MNFFFYFSLFFIFQSFWSTYNQGIGDYIEYTDIFSLSVSAQIFDMTSTGP